MARNVMTQQEKYEAEKLFGLTGSYDKKSLKKAYGRMVREWHPDLARRNGHTDDEATKMTAKINTAFVSLSGLFDGSVTTVQCESAPQASSASTGYASHGTGTKTGYGTGYGTGRSTGATAATSGTGYATSTSTDAEHDAPHASASQTNDIPDFAPEGSYRKTYDRGEVPRNMAAAMRYTRIVTDSNYVKWFVAGLGPHVVWALACLAFLFLIGLLMSGVFGPGGIIMWVKMLPIAVIYDVATGHGAEVVASVADIWAVNKAVKGTD